MLILGCIVTFETPPYARHLRSVVPRLFSNGRLVPDSVWLVLRLTSEVLGGGLLLLR